MKKKCMAWHVPKPHAKEEEEEEEEEGGGVTTPSFPNTIEARHELH
jgi:hypothetical protein